MTVKTKPRVEAPDDIVEEAKVDSAKIVELGSKVRKLMGASPEMATLTIGKTVQVAAEFPGGSVIFKNKEALIDPYFGKRISVIIPFDVLNAALIKRGIVRISMVDGQLVIKGSRYSASLNVEKAKKKEEFHPIKGQDSKPMMELLKDASNLLYLTHMLEENTIDAHFRWDDKSIVAAAADPYHGVLIEGPAESESKHSVTLPVDLATKLALIGGEFEIGETRILAESNMGRAEINQVPASETIVPLDSIIGLKNNRPEWSASLNSDDLNALLSNLGAVIEQGVVIEFLVKDNYIAVNSKGRFGQVKGRVEIVSVKGKAPSKLTVKPIIFNSIIEKVKGNISLSLTGNLLQVTPLKQDKWKFYGFLHLQANE